MTTLCSSQTKSLLQVYTDLMPEAVLQYKLGRPQKQGQTVQFEMKRERDLSVWYRGICRPASAF